MALTEYDSADEDAAEEERKSLMMETAGEESSAAAKNNVPYKQKTTRPAQKESTSANWKVVSQILLLIGVGMGILVLTDTIEINVITHGELEQGDVEQRHPKPRPASSIMDIPNDGADIVFGEPANSEKEDTKKSPEDKSPWTSQSSNNDKGGASSSSSSFTYQTRAQPYDKSEEEEMLKEWKGWSMTKSRSSVEESFYLKYPNRDVPKDAFPKNAWQRDEEYLQEFLSQSSDLVDRTMTAILKEYGKEPDDDMFELEMFNFTSDTLPKSSSMDGAGWTTEASFLGIKRRLLHAIMTEDSFTWALSGHSASAGHGNHFQQSYTEQIQWIMEAVFARLGVKHEARNVGMGGLGTLQTGLAAASILGPHVDVIMWDSGMTEREISAPEILLRQQLLGGLRVPVFWNFPGSLMTFYEQLGLHVGGQTNIKTGIPLKEKMSDFDSAPWASRYLNCESSLHDHCRSQEYRGVCWIEREDVTPVTQQKPEPGGRAGWHPGDRHHQLRGRALTMILLKALKEIFEEWKSKEQFVWEDDEWHVTKLYEQQRNAIQGNKMSDCNEKFELQMFCDIPFRGITEFTPRAFPSLTSIRSAMPKAQVEFINDAPKNIYHPPDVFNPNLHPPKGEVDVLKIVELGDAFEAVNVPDYTGYYQQVDVLAEPSQPVGQGVYLDTRAGDVYCDGTVSSFCSRGPGENCLLYGHNDGRNGLIHDSYSGWIFFRLKIKEGHVTLKIESWHWPFDNPKTSDWTSINNEDGAVNGSNEGGGDGNDEDETKRQRNLDALAGIADGGSERNLKEKVPEFCNDFAFDISIDGKITTLDKQQIGSGDNSLKYKPQRVVETINILDDPEFTGGEEKEIEFGIRMRGCGATTRKTFKLTHIYWA